MKYFSIRVMNAKDGDTAYDKLCNEDFAESHPLCDMILSEDDLIEAVLKIAASKEKKLNKLKK